MRYTHGFSIVELLMALVLFITILVLVATAGVNGLKFNASQAATVSAQAKLRRVSEVMTQSLRNASFGSVTNTPFTSNEKQVSFLTFPNGTGYPLDRSVANFSSSQQITFISSSDPELGSASHVVLFDNAATTTANENNAVLFPISDSRPQGAQTYQIDHDGCTNQKTLTPQLVLYPALTVGYRYDDASDTLFEQLGGTERAFAYGVTTFEVGYVYTENTTDDTFIRAAPYQDDFGRPAKRHYPDPVNAPNVFRTLTAIKLNLEVLEAGKTRSLSTEVPLSSTTSGTFRFEGVTPCS